MSRAQTKYRPNVEQVESRQMLSAVPSGYAIPSKQGHIDTIGDGFVGFGAAPFNSTMPVYLSSLTNTTGEKLKIDGVFASVVGPNKNNYARSNITFDKTASTLIHNGRILFWTQDPNAKFLIDLSVVDKPTISTSGQVPASAAATASGTQFRKTGTGDDQVGWERIDFPLAKSSTYTITAVRNTSDKITRIMINTPST